MARLISRQKQIPGGFIYYVPQTGFKTPRFASFQTIVNALIAHRKGNPHLAKKHKWSTDPTVVANEVDEFNANVCLRMGWKGYVAQQAAGGQLPPSPFRRSKTVLESLNAVAAGVGSVKEMFGADGPIKDKALAEARGAVCAACPLNLRGDWTSWFTVPVSAMIRSALSLIKGQGMETAADEQLMVCSACSCPCRLKIWARIEHINAHMPQESKEALDPKCWIRSETKSE